MTDTTQPEALRLADASSTIAALIKFALYWNDSDKDDQCLVRWPERLRRAESKQWVLVLDGAAAELRRLQADQAELTACVTKQREILRNVVIAVREQPPEDMGWSSHDAAELVQSVVADRDRLQAENESLRADAGRFQWLIDNCVLGIKQNGLGWSLNTRACVAPDSIRGVRSAIDAAKAGQ